MENILLCSKCAKDENFIQFIRDEGSAGTCSLCRQERDYVIEPPLAANLFKALIRYHYSEEEYNEHWGGEYPPTLLRQENPIIHTENIAPAELESDFDYDQLIDELTSPVWPSSDEEEKNGVWIFFGSDFDGSRGLYPESIKDQTAAEITSLLKDLRTTNYSALEFRWGKILAKYFEHLARSIYPGEEMYRARVGVAGEFNKFSGGFAKTYVVVPYEGSEISAPPQLLAKPGRLNRSNISYLYLASDADTALAEVRPHPGNVVSIGRFRLEQRIQIVDLANVKLLPFATNDETLNTFTLLRNIEQAFATPISPDASSTGYIATQFLADIVRQLGYDGVTYRSSVTTGTNLTVFKPEAFEYVLGSAEARQVASLVYGYTTPVVEAAPRGGDSDYYPISKGI